MSNTKKTRQQRGLCFLRSITVLTVNRPASQ